jgi:putative flippase GtrA
MIAGRALVVGLACAVLHNAIMIAGDWGGLHYALSLVISFVIVVVVGYLLHSGWTFAAERSRASFGRYVLIALGNYPVTLAFMFVFVDLVGLSVPLASPLVTLLMFVANFAGNRWALRGQSSRQT